MSHPPLVQPLLSVLSQSHTAYSLKYFSHKQALVNQKQSQTDVETGNFELEHTIQIIQQKQMKKRCQKVYKNETKSESFKNIETLQETAKERKAWIF